jgi:hypothetical protein
MLRSARRLLLFGIMAFGDDHNVDEAWIAARRASAAAVGVSHPCASHSSDDPVSLRHGMSKARVLVIQLRALLGHFDPVIRAESSAVHACGGL